MGSPASAASSIERLPGCVKVAGARARDARGARRTGARRSEQAIGPCRNSAVCLRALNRSRREDREDREDRGRSARRGCQRVREGPAGPREVVAVAGGGAASRCNLEPSVLFQPRCSRGWCCSPCPSKGVVARSMPSSRGGVRATRRWVATARSPHHRAARARVAPRRTSVRQAAGPIQSSWPAWCAPRVVPTAEDLASEAQGGPRARPL